MKKIKTYWDSEYREMTFKEIAEAKRTFHKNAVKILEESGADHVVYCRVSYTAKGEIEQAHFYNNLALNDEEFHENIKTTGTDYIGAVHRQKIFKIKARRLISSGKEIV